MTGHHQLIPYEDIKASSNGNGGSEDSCYGSNDLSRSSSSAHGVARPLLTPQHRSSSLSSTSVEYAIPNSKQLLTQNNNKIINIDIVNTDETIPSHHLKTFQSSSHYSLKKTVQSLTRRPMVNLQSTYLTYDSIDAPPSPPPPNHSLSSTPSTTSREYSI